MRLSVELVDPIRSVARAAAVLRAAWTPPCLHYSDAYVRWQLTFPGNVPVRLALAFAGRQSIGCAGLTPRQFLLNGEYTAAYVLSFVAVDPSWRGHGLGARLYETLLDGIAPQVPIVVFTQPDSTGERLLLRAFASEFTHQPLRQCRAAGYARVLGEQKNDGRVRNAREDEFLAALSHIDAAGIFWNAPSPAVLSHYLSDPRSRSLMVIGNREGEPTGTAMRVAVEIVNGSTLQLVPMLENVRLTEPSPSDLEAAFDATGEVMPGSTTVVAPNLSHIDISITRAARARLLPSVYNAHIFLRHVKCEADATNIEVT
jgi:GNAT superfamily N-acetyltransferase